METRPHSHMNPLEMLARDRPSHSREAVCQHRGIPDLKICLNLLKPATYRCDGPAGLGFVTLAKPERSLVL